MEESGLEEKIKAKVLEQLKDLVSWKSEDRVYDFAELEEQVLVVGRAMMQEMLRAVVADEQGREQQQRARPEPVCEGCGRAMRHGGRKRKRVASKVGQIDLEREYYHCRSCQQGVFPPGLATGTGRREVESGLKTGRDVASS